MVYTSLQQPVFFKDGNFKLPTCTIVLVITEFISCATGAVVAANSVMTIHFTASIVGRAFINIYQNVTSNSYT